MKRSPALVGIETREAHGRTAYRGAVWRGGRSKKGPWLPSLAAARSWRVDELRRSEREREHGGDPVLVREAVAEFLTAAELGHVRTRSGDVFRPGVLAEYRRHFEARIVPRWGSVRLHELERAQLQGWVGELQAAGLSAQTVKNVLVPLRTLYREADTLGLGPLREDPTSGLRLPATRSKRARVVAPSEAELYLAALEAGDRPLWAAAFYLGLRAGELAALRAEDVDLAAGLVRVHPERGNFDWKMKTFGPPKSRAGARTLPVAGALRPRLAALDGREGLLFGRDAEVPWSYGGVTVRAARAWREAGLAPLTPHECRHTFASYLIAAGLNAKAVSVLLGHSSVAITFDRYGHLFPGHEDEARELLDSFLCRSGT